MLRNKKAVSPLIATVLLLVVTVGIGGVIVGIIRNYVTENRDVMDSKADELSCSRDVVLSVMLVDGVPQVCKGSNYINILLENTGVKIDDFQFTVMGLSGFYRNESISAGSPMLNGETKEFNVMFTGITSDEIQQVKFTPKLKKKSSTGYNFCSDVAITYEEEIPPC